MKTVSSPVSRAANRCPSPVEIWQRLLTHLLVQHYGLALNDTPFSNEDVIRQHIDGGIALADALNFIVEKYELVRIDRAGFSAMQQSPFISKIDMLRARSATGLMTRSRYKQVTAVTTGRSYPEQG